MTPEYIASKLALLPQFEVTAIHHLGDEQNPSSRLDGVFSEVMIAERQGATLFLRDLRFMDGTLLATSGPSLHRSIEVGRYAWSRILEDEVFGSTLTFFGNYDHRRLNLVINQAIAWERTDFSPRPALQKTIVGTDGKPYRQTTQYFRGADIPADSTVVELAWDHEHCVFCWNRIDSETPGFLSRSDDDADGEWSCPWCYHHAIEPHNPRPLLTPYRDRN